MKTKKEFLQWINSSIQTSYEKIEHLGDCVAYVELLKMYYPNEVDLSSIKCNNKKIDF